MANANAAIKNAAYLAGVLFLFISILTPKLRLHLIPYLSLIDR